MVRPARIPTIVFGNLGFVLAVILLVEILERKDDSNMPK